MEGHGPLAEGNDSRLVVALKDDRLALRDTEATDTLEGQGRRSYGAVALAGNAPGAHRPRLPVLEDEDGRNRVLLVTPHEGIVHMDFWDGRLLLVAGRSPVGRVVASPRDAVRAPRAVREVRGLVRLPFGLRRFTGHNSVVVAPSSLPTATPLAS